MTKQKDVKPAPGANGQLSELFEWIAESEALKSTDNWSIASPLRPLKTIVWSIDWEISDKILLVLNEEINRLKLFYEEDKTVLKFLQLMEAVGKYIGKRKGRSHPESVILLRDFFVELERIVFMMGMPDGERKDVLQRQIRKFIALKKKLAAEREVEGPPGNTSPVKTGSEAKLAPPPAEAEEPLKKSVPPKKSPEVKKTPEPVEAAPGKKAPEKIASEEKNKQTAPKKIPPEVKKVAADTKKKAPADTENQTSLEINPDVFRQMLLDEMRLVIRYEFKKIKAELTEMIENKLSGKKS